MNHDDVVIRVHLDLPNGSLRNMQYRTIDLKFLLIYEDFRTASRIEKHEIFLTSIKQPILLQQYSTKRSLLRTDEYTNDDIPTTFFNKFKEKRSSYPENNKEEDDDDDDDNNNNDEDEDEDEDEDDLVSSEKSRFYEISRSLSKGTSCYRTHVKSVKMQMRAGRATLHLPRILDERYYVPLRTTLTRLTEKYRRSLRPLGTKSFPGYLSTSYREKTIDSLARLEIYASSVSGTSDLIRAHYLECTYTPVNSSSTEVTHEFSENECLNMQIEFLPFENSRAKSLTGHDVKT
ncbi:LOW QUALITY PROTEIN: hypothetical protein V1478_002522 [Vespula squamosa]|uniref:Uncharacterized protein n=1 Tax=Vespula squamosa TaxID=30214 RepID=A0ABD2BSS6_VESSQ